MGRTFTAVWTLSLPFVLIGDDFAEDSLSTFTFVILLTYGFLGLEFLSRMLANPFGEHQRDAYLKLGCTDTNIRTNP